MREDLVEDIGGQDLREKIVYDDPLVVEPDGSLNVKKRPVWMICGKPIVEAEE